MLVHEARSVSHVHAVTLEDSWECGISYCLDGDAEIASERAFGLEIVTG
jgi:hypothetical protein